MFLLKVTLTVPNPPPRAGTPIALIFSTTIELKASRVMRAWSP
jgi:hypothetical protein